MKRLLLGLLLLSGLAIQAEEPAVQPEMPKAVEQDAAQAQYAQEIKELIEKEKEALLEGVEEKAKALKPLIEECNKLLIEHSEKSWNQAVQLDKEINYGITSFWAARIRNFSNYSADKAGYLGVKCYLNLTSALLEQLPAASDENKAKEEFERKALEAVTKNDIEELTNCIRANEVPDKEKDKNCFDLFFNVLIIYSLGK